MPGLTILVTSRRPLGLHGEQCHEVPPLVVPPIGADPADVESTEAGALFGMRARSHHPGSRIDPETAPAVAEICRLLDGVPLAIELAAGRLSTLSAPEIATRLGDRLDLLGGHQHGAWGPHQTLEEALDWGFDQLLPSEQTLLRRLGYFPVEADFEAIHAICSGGAVEPEGVLALLAGLVSSGMVTADTRGAEARYRLPTAVQQFARDRLAASADSAEVEARHASWYGHWAEEVEPFLSGPDQRIHRKRLDLDSPNSIAALRSGEKRGDTEQVLRLATALTPWWADRGSPSEGRTWFDRALSHEYKVELNLRAKALWSSATLALALGDTVAARPMIQEALAIANSEQIDIARCRLLYLDGRCSVREGKLEEAAVAFDNSLDMARGIRDGWTEAHALVQRGALAEGRAELAAATTLLEQGLTVSEREGDLESLTDASGRLGALARRSADHWSADLYLQRSLDVANQAGRPAPAARALLGLGLISGDAGDVDTARRHLLAAREGAGTVGLGACAVEAAIHLGRLALRLAPPLQAPLPPTGRRRRPEHLARGGATVRARTAPAIAGGAEAAPVEARRWLQEALEQLEWSLPESAGSLALASTAHGAMALAEAAEGRLDEAAETAAVGLRLARRSASPATLARALLVVGVLARKANDLPASRNALGEALGAARRSGEFLTVVDCMDGLGGVIAAGGRLSHAARVFGATSSLRADRRLEPNPVDCPFRDADVTALRERMFVDDFDAAWSEGAELAIDPAAELAAQGLVADGDTANGWEKLTAAERAVVALVNQGLTNRQMGERLGISSHTVQSHLAHVFAKLGVRSRTVLMREAADRQRLLDRINRLRTEKCP